MPVLRAAGKNDVEVKLHESTASLVKIHKKQSQTDEVVDLLQLKFDSTGTPAANLGVGIAVQIDDGGGVEEQGSIDWLLTTVTDTAEDCDVVFKSNKAGTITEWMRYDASAGAILLSEPLKTAAGETAVLDLSGNATGESDVVVADNLASAFEIREAANSYLTIVTTNSSEAIKFGYPLTSTAGMSAVLDLSAAATGESDIVLKDNIADALSVRESTNAYVTFVTTNSAEQIDFKKRITTTDGVASGTVRVVGGLAYSNTAASTAVTGASGAEQAYDVSYTIPADTLKAGTVVKITWQVNVSGVAANDNMVNKLYIGGLSGTALQTTTGTDPEAADMVAGEYTLICRTAGASGTFVGHGSFTTVPGPSGTATRVSNYTASTTINTTAAQAITISSDWDGTTSASNTSRLDILAVEIY